MTPATLADAPLPLRPGEELLPQGVGPALQPQHLHPAEPLGPDGQRASIRRGQSGPALTRRGCADTDPSGPDCSRHASGLAYVKTSSYYFCVYGHCSI